MLLYVILVLSMALCGLCAIRARQLLTSVLWLSLLSVLTAILLYMLGAPEIAVIELSVGAGLVTVLFVFAIGIAGDITRDLASLVPRWLAWTLAVAVLALLGRLVWPVNDGSASGAPIGSVLVSFPLALWEARAVDMVVAIVLVLAGVLGMLNLLQPTQTPTASSATSPKSVPERGPTPIAPQATAGNNGAHQNGKHQNGAGQGERQPEPRVPLPEVQS